jgi:hypothetical protein
MNKKKLVAVVILVVSGVFSMWARYAYEKAEQRKREALFRQLSTYSTSRAEPAPSAETPAEPPAPVEPRSVLDSTLPQEMFELVRQTVGADFKLMELRLNEDLNTFTLSTDGKTVQQYQVDKNSKKVSGPSAVNVIGDNPLDDSLFDPKVVNFTLIPRLVKEAVERAGLPEGKAESVSISYPIIYTKGEGPDWVVYVESGEGESWQHKFVRFDTKGKFKDLS